MKKKPIRLDAEADEELASAHARYEAKVVGLGEDLADALHPKPFPLAPKVPRTLGVRRAPLGPAKRLEHQDDLLNAGEPEGER